MCVYERLWVEGFGGMGRGGGGWAMEGGRRGNGIASAAQGRGHESIIIKVNVM
jgi:hypothetical protein